MENSLVDIDIKFLGIDPITLAGYYRAEAVIGEHFISRVIPVSASLIQSTAIDLEPLLREQFLRHL